MRGFDLHEQGWSGTSIAEALGLTKGAVSQWLKRARQGGGREALRHRPPPGSKPHLNAEQRTWLTDLLAQGAEAHDFVGEVWTAPRIATLIAREFGVRHHPAHVGRILRSLGWTPQKPVRRALQRDEAAIAAWQQAQWPQLKAKATKKTGRSSLSMSPAFTCCCSWRGRMPHAARRPCCAPRLGDGAAGVGDHERAGP